MWLEFFSLGHIQPTEQHYWLSSYFSIFSTKMHRGRQNLTANVEVATLRTFRLCAHSFCTSAWQQPVLPNKSHST